MYNNHDNSSECVINFSMSIKICFIIKMINFTAFPAISLHFYRDGQNFTGYRDLAKKLTGYRDLPENLTGYRDSDPPIAPLIYDISSKNRSTTSRRAPV